MEERMVKRMENMAKGAIIIIFIALLRTVLEPLRLQYYSASAIAFEQVKPFIIAALVVAIGLFSMTVFLFYGRYKIIIVLAILIIVLMLMIKYMYQMP